MTEPIEPPRDNRVACTSATARDAVRATVNEPESQEQ